MKGYGSSTTNNGSGGTNNNNPPVTPPRRNLSGSAASSSSYKTPKRKSDTLPRNQSNSAETSNTQETDPLLGEGLLGSAVDDVKVNLAKTLKPRTNHSSAPDLDLGRIKTNIRASSPLDPHIGHNVVINDELDTLAYSYEHDDSTFRHFLDEVEEQKRGFLHRVAGSDPAFTLVCIGLAVGIAICAIPALLYVKFHRHQGATTIIPGGDAVDKTSAINSAWNGVPFQKISRGAYGDPVSNFLDKSLFHPSLLYHGEGVDVASAKLSTNTQNTDNTTALTVGNNDERRRLSTTLKPFLHNPFPTGAFWTNLVLLPQTESGKPKQSTKSQSSYPIVAYPYSYQWSTLGKLQVSYSAARRKIQPNSIQDAFAPDVTIGSVDNIHIRHVLRFDSLSVTLRFYGDADDTSKQNSTDFDNMRHWDTYIVQGSPYVTARYYGLRPELTALSDFTDIVCPPAMKAQEERQTTGATSESNSTDHNQRKLGIFSQPSSPVATSTPSKKLGVCGVSENSTQQRKIITGVQFVVTTQEGLIWLVFASEPITFEFNQAARRVIKSSTPFQGVIRLALVPPATLPSAASNVPPSSPLDLESIASSSAVKRLIYHAGTFPVGGSVNWVFRTGTRSPISSSNAAGKRRMIEITDIKDSQFRNRDRQLSSDSPKGNNIGSITFSFDTQHMSALDTTSTSAQKDLLMLSLPHHAASITSANDILFNPQEFDLFFRCIKGRMVPVVGNSWTYEEELTSIGFDDETPYDEKSGHNPVLSVSTLDQTIQDLILQTVESDLNINLPVLESGAYGFGKGIARLAQLALIADSIEGVAHASSKKVAPSKNNESQASNSTAVLSRATSQRAYALLEKYLTMWLVGDGGVRRLFYDVDLGGIVSKDGLTDVFSDFGNVRYNGKNEK